LSRKEELDGFVLERESFGEIQLLLTLYTRLHGRVKAVLYGSGGRRDALLHPANRVLVWGAMGHHRFLIEEVELGLEGIALADPAKGRAWGRLLARLCHPQLVDWHPDAGLFDLIAAYHLSLLEGRGGEQVSHRLAWRLLQAAGQAPDLTRCVRCGAPLHDDPPPGLLRQGLGCPRCASQPLAPHRWRALRNLVEGGTGEGAAEVLRHWVGQAFEDRTL